MWSNNTWPSLKISDKTNTLYTGSTLTHTGRITYTSQYMCTHRRHTFISTDKCAQAVEQMAHLFTVDRKANLLLYLWFYACNSACGCENMWANVCVCVCVMKHGGQFGIVNEIDLIRSWRRTEWLGFMWWAEGERHGGLLLPKVHHKMWCIKLQYCTTYYTYYTTYLILKYLCLLMHRAILCFDHLFLHNICYFEFKLLSNVEKSWATRPLLYKLSCNLLSSVQT